MSRDIHIGHREHRQRGMKMNATQIRINEIKRHLNMVAKRGVKKVAYSIGCKADDLARVIGEMRVELKGLEAR